MTVGLVYDPIYLKHDTGAHVENYGRLVSTMEVLEESGLLGKGANLVLDAVTAH